MPNNDRVEAVRIKFRAHTDNQGDGGTAVLDEIHFQLVSDPNLVVEMAWKLLP
jgi:hypothetical protein